MLAHPPTKRASAAMYLLYGAVRGTERNVPPILWSIQPNGGERESERAAAAADATGREREREGATAAAPVEIPLGRRRRRHHLI